jgi:hypothetical protein
MGNSGGLIRQSGALKKAAPGLPARYGNTGTLISAHYLEIEYLLDRVEQSTTCYQVLGVERTATNEQIVVSYHQTVGVLHPSYYKVRAAVPDELLERIDKAFGKVSQAFLVLTDHRRRTDYDKSLNRSKVVPLPLNVTKPKRVRNSGGLKRAKAKRDSATLSAPTRAAIAINAPQPQAIYTRPADATETPNRRRCERYNIAVPAMVSGYDRAGNRWQEITKTLDVSRMGVAMRLQARVRHGMILHVTLPLPTKLRSHGFTEQGYNMYAIVRRVEPFADGRRVVGLEFVGNNPPAGYLHKPWAAFRTQKWNGADRRREPRFVHKENVLIEYLDGSRHEVAREIGITDDVSASGARVAVKLAPDDFEMVRVTSANQEFVSFALVRNRFTIDDGSERLCLLFIENKWPL